MHPLIRHLSLCAFACALSFSVHAAPGQSVLSVSSHDQIATRLASSAVTLDRASLDRVPSAMSWALEADAALEQRPQPFREQSREYWIDASEAELRRGVNLPTSATGALIRFSPHAGARATLAREDLQISNGARRLSADQAIQALASEDELRAAGMDVPQGSVVLRLSEAAGSGMLQISARSAQGDWLIHVYEPASKVVLNLQAAKDSVLAGDALVITASMEGGASLQGLAGLLSAPSGFSQSFDFVRQRDGSFRASVVPDARHAGGHGLWEIHAFGNAVNGKQTIQRDARTAVAVSVAGARLSGAAEPLPSLSRQREVAVQLAVEVEVASRYQLAGVLYGTSADGQLRPAAVAHSAAWLERGQTTMQLRFDAAALTPSGLKAPYELRDLRLLDQADMSLIERRERAMALD